MSDATIAPPITATSRPVRAWSPARVAGGCVLGAWAVLFWWLQVSGRVNLYLSTRTQWVVPVGAVLLTLAAVGRLVSARVPAAEPLRRREAIVMAAMTLPVVILLALPPATLDQYSAGKKATYSSSLAYQSIYGQITATSEITWFSIAAGQTSTPGAQALAKRAGSDVDFIGIVTRYPDTPADEFLLTRYVITCCVADATIVQVRVVNVIPGSAAANQWVDVQGQVYPLGREVIVNANTIVVVPRPAKPYLTP